jgi:glycosyltransferase involved in cell wall biosynthesis
MSLDLLLLPQLRAIAQAGYDVVTASAPGPHVGALTAAGIRHVPLRHATRAMAPLADLRSIAELHRLFRDERPDIVHTHNPKPGWFGRPAARAARVPVVVNTVHGLYATPTDPLARRTAVYALERAAAACSDAELVQNVEDVATLRRLRVPADRLTVLGNGVDLARFAPGGRTEAAHAIRRAIGASDAEVVVGAVGRLVWEKGLRELLEAGRRLGRTHPHVRLVVIGPPDPSKADGITAAELPGLSEATGVAFLPAREDIEAAYGAFDAYVLASHREGFPRSAMEAAATSLPVVATDIRGCRQVVDHGRTGLLVPPRDPGALADALVRVGGDAELRASMGRAARAKAEAEFDQDEVVARTLDAYERLLRERGRRRSVSPAPSRDREGSRR